MLLVRLLSLGLELRSRETEEAFWMSRIALISASGTRSHLLRMLRWGTSSWSMQLRDRRLPEMNLAGSVTKVASTTKIATTWYPQSLRSPTNLLEGGGRGGEREG